MEPRQRSWTEKTEVILVTHGLISGKQLFKKCKGGWYNEINVLGEIRGSVFMCEI